MGAKLKSDTIDLIVTDESSVDLIVTDESSERKVTMIRKNDNKDVGNFVIKGEINGELSMEIFIEDEYQGKGFARKMIHKLCSYLEEKYNIEQEKLLSIDGDGSDTRWDPVLKINVSFWDSVGLKDNRYGYDYHGKRDLEGKGYEKNIAFRELCIWARPAPQAVPAGVNKRKREGGGRKKTRRLSRKKTRKLSRKKTRKLSRKIPRKYTKGLSKKDQRKQQKNIRKAIRSYKTKRGSQRYVSRPRLRSYKHKKSQWLLKYEKKYGEDNKSYKEISKKTKIPIKALQEVVKKGKGAYYSSGSRPNQTAESWGKARMYSFIMGGPTRKYDNHIAIKYKLPFAKLK